MKTSFQWLVLPLLLCGNLIAQTPVSTTNPAGTTRVDKERQGWRYVWGDEFDGTQLDTTLWSKIPRGSGADWKRHMSSADSLYAVSGGTLKLYGAYNTDLAADTSAFLTAGVYTKDKATIQWGRVEVRAKLPQAQGCWPAIWMLPNEGKWPYGGEIDIMEHLNFDNIIYQTVHSYYTFTLGKKENPPSHDTARFDPTAFNTFTVEKWPDRLVFFVNDVKTFEYPRVASEEAEGQYPYMTPYYLLVDMQIEGAWVGAADPQQYPVAMEVDWVRVYEASEE